MRISFNINSVDRVGELAATIVDVLSRVDELHPTRLLLRDYDRGEIPDTDALAVAARDAKGGLALRTRAGTIDLSWRYVPNAWFQLVGGEVAVSARSLGAIVSVVRELSETLKSAYSAIDLAKICTHDANSYTGEGADSPWSRLDDLYWYNYFGAELTHVLRDEHQIVFDVPGARQRQLERGWEVWVDGPPQERPYPAPLEKYLTDVKVFRKYNRKARFKSAPIEFDYSRVRDA